jgi:hypothetical protein
MRINKHPTCVAEVEGGGKRRSKEGARCSRSKEGDRRADNF